MAYGFEVRYPTVLFDLDHTLMDSDQSEADALAETFGAHHIEVTDDLLRTYDEINQALWRSLERGEIGVNQLRVQRFDELVEVAELSATGQQLADDFTYWLGECGELFDGAADMLRSLSADAELGLVTNGVGKTQRARIDRFGFDALFSSVVISGEFGSSKPGTAIFDESLRQLGNPDRQGVIMIGDSLASDMAGASAAGIAACWYNPDGKPQSSSVKVDHTVASLAELPDLVRGGA